MAQKKTVAVPWTLIGAPGVKCRSSQPMIDRAILVVMAGVVVMVDRRGRLEKDLVTELVRVVVLVPDVVRERAHHEAKHKDPEAGEREAARLRPTRGTKRMGRGLNHPSRAHHRPLTAIDQVATPADSALARELGVRAGAVSHRTVPPASAAPPTTNEMVASLAWVIALWRKVTPSALQWISSLQNLRPAS